MKIKFESNDNLPTDNIINMHQVTIIIRLVFQRGKKLYPQIYLDDCLYKSYIIIIMIMIMRMIMKMIMIMRLRMKNKKIFFIDLTN